MLRCKQESTPDADADAEAQAESTPTADTDTETQTSDNKALQRSAMSIEADPWTPVQIVQAWADHEQVMGENSLGGVIANAIDDKPETGWALDRRNENRQAIFLVAAPFGNGRRQIENPA